MKPPILVFVAICMALTLTGCERSGEPAGPFVQPDSSSETAETGHSERTPRIASWLAKKDQIIESQKPYDLVMSGWFTPEEAMQIRSSNPEAILLAGLTVNWVLENSDWMTFLTTVASYGRESPLVITDDMYLRSADGQRCAFGWKSESWGHEEIYAMDPRNPGWIELITSFYKNVLDQPQHDGIIIDMVMKISLFPEVLSDEELATSTRMIMESIRQHNATNKLVILNSGRELWEIDAYSEYMDGYVMENLLGNWGADFETGLAAADGSFLIVYAVDTDDTGRQDLNRMRLGLTLSMLTDSTYFTYDFGPRDHGQAWWFDEYDAALGQPLGSYYRQEDAYHREFENGVVVAAPSSDTTVTFGTEHIDVTTGEIATVFRIRSGDGRIFRTYNSSQ